MGTWIPNYIRIYFIENLFNNATITKYTISFLQKYTLPQICPPHEERKFNTSNSEHFMASYKCLSVRMK
jgi:hypothetical protein